MRSWQGLKARSLPFYCDLGPVCFRLGAGAKDADMREGLDFRFQDAIDGPEGRELDPEHRSGGQHRPCRVDPAAQQALDASLPMVCANPDRVVMRGTAKELCAGSLAEWYEAEGGAVQWHGKPFADVYRVARAAMGLQRQQVLATVTVSPMWQVPGRQGSTCCWSTPVSIRRSAPICRLGWNGCPGKGTWPVLPITGSVSEPRIH